jgi:Predicted glutamine amidotransferase
MSANVPTDICFSFTGLMQRGGRTGPHRDGWGIAFYEGRGCRTFHDPRPSADSELAELVRCWSIKSRIVVSHIRQATHGRVCLENTHPFTRELWGRTWVFAHNGKLKGIKRRRLKFYKPVGTTDSEHAFCWMLDRIRENFSHPPRRPESLWRLLQVLTEDLHKLGTFNLLLADSRYLYAYCGNYLSWLTRRAPFGQARLIDAEVVVDFQHETTPEDIVTVIATQPLTHNEVWHTMTPGTLIIFYDGLPVVWPKPGSRTVPLPRWPAPPLRAEHLASCLNSL